MKGELEGEAEAARRDRALLAALLAVRGPREGPTYQKGEAGVLAVRAEPSADEQFAAAFREWDPAFDVDALPTAEAAARLKARPPVVVTEAVAALDEWASERRRRGMDPARWLRLVELAQAADDDPGPRRRELREILAHRDLAREKALGSLAVALRPVLIPFDAGLLSKARAMHRIAVWRV